MCVKQEQLNRDSKAQKDAQEIQIGIEIREKNESELKIVMQREETIINDEEMKIQLRQHFTSENKDTKIIQLVKNTLYTINFKNDSNIDSGGTKLEHENEKLLLHIKRIKMEFKSTILQNPPFQNQFFEMKMQITQKVGQVINSVSKIKETVFIFTSKCKNYE